MDSDTNYKETELRLGPPGASSPVRETKNLLVVETKKCSEDSSSSSATSELALLSPRRSSAEKKFFPDDDEKSPQQQQQQQQQQQSQNNQQQQQQQKTNQNQFWNTAAPAVQIQGLAGAKRGFSQAMEGRKVWGFSPDKLSVDTGAASKNGSTVVLPPMVAGSPKAGPPVWPAEHAFMNGSSAPVPRSGSAAAVNLSNNGSRQLLNDAPGSSSREPVAAKVSVPEMPVAPKAPEERPSAPKVQAVGWPPIRNFRRNSLAPKQADDKESKLGNGALYVKVSMDGAPYLRKVDLKMYKKYQELSSALERMFTCFTIGQYGSHGTTGRDGLSESKLMDLLSGSEYVLTYEDKDSDWMLVGDVPWEMFVDSCRRLRIMKSSEAIGLAPRAMEKSKNRC